MSSVWKVLVCAAVFAVSSGCIGPETQTLDSNGSSSNLIIFITSTDHSGNLGGISGADSICNARASSAGLPGSFVAWISDSSTDAIDRITSNGPWKWVNGSVVFSNKAAIANAQVSAPAYQENGLPPTGDDSWTGTNADGTNHSSNCNNWNSSSNTDTGMEGDFDEPGIGSWSTKEPETCNKLRKLICFQL